MQSLFCRSAGRAWRYFAEICTIPRGSGHEDGISAWLRDQATSQGWAVISDAVGNLRIRVPGKGRLLHDPGLILQGHMDMVCEKNEGAQHDFLKDPIEPELDGDWLVARETTLGADNGVAIALALAVAAGDQPDRVPLELLFTVDEERGLTGASNLDATILQGRRLLNLDSSDDASFVAGCAGGVDMEIAFPLGSIAAVDAWRIVIRGLRGGHSGADIHENRGHSIQIVAALCRRIPELLMHSLNGGNKKNAIPREADVVVSGCGQERLTHELKDLFEAIAVKEPEAKFSIEAITASEVLAPGVSTFLAAVPMGVIDWDESLPGVVRTSNSIGVVRTGRDAFSMLAHGRSSAAECLDSLLEQVADLALQSGGSFSASNRYPGWQPCMHNELLNLASEVYSGVFKKAPEVTAIHAGLEAGIIGAKLCTDALLAYGPLMEGLHAPGERLNIPSFDRVYSFLNALVAWNGSESCG